MKRQHDSRFRSNLTGKAAAMAIASSFAFTVMSASAATIVWGAATTISSSTDVVTTGTMVQSYTGNNTGGDFTINGETFLQGRIPGATGSTDLNAGATNTGDTVYDDFVDLQSFNIGTTGSTGTITLSSLTNGQNYLVQIWYADNRNVTPAVGREKNTQLEDGNGNTVTLLGAVGSVSTGLGQWVTGTFTASGTTQDILVHTYNDTLRTSSGSNALNGLQLRTIPEPGSALLGGLGLLVLLRRRRG